MKPIRFTAKSIASVARRLRGSMQYFACVAVVAIAIQPVAHGADCSMTSIGLTPINDLGSGSYLGWQGGLYPGGINSRPAGHESAGLDLARSIGPMNSNGDPDPDGKYVLLSIGMSNASQEFNAFEPDANEDRDKDPALVVVNGAQGGATAAKWAIPSSVVWSEAMQMLSQQGVNANQVAVVWAKLANSATGKSVDQYRGDLQRDVEAVVSILADEFPNLKLVYLTSRIYAGYATSSLNPEPYAYESGFVMKWVIEKQLDGELTGTPWLSWGPYPWADGLSPRSDGLTWECGDLREDDGTHPSDIGKQKVASMLLDFFRTDSTAQEWYMASPGTPREDIVAPAPPENLVVDP